VRFEKRLNREEGPTDFVTDSVFHSIFPASQGPAYVPSGMHKPAYLIGLEPETPTSEMDVKRSATLSSRASNDTITTSRIGKSDSVFIYETSVDIHRKDQQNNLPPNLEAPWIVNVSLSLHSTQAFDSPTLAMSFSNTSISSGALSLSSPIKAGDNDALWALFEVASNGTDAPELWWPAHFGNPTLYDLNLELSPDDQDKVNWFRRTGFRTIVLNQEDYSQEEIDSGFAPGSKFQFEINGKISESYSSSKPVSFSSLVSDLISFPILTFSQHPWIKHHPNGYSLRSCLYRRSRMDHRFCYGSWSKSTSYLGWSFLPVDSILRHHVRKRNVSLVRSYLRLLDVSNIRQLR